MITAAEISRTLNPAMTESYIGALDGMSSFAEYIRTRDAEIGVDAMCAELISAGMAVGDSERNKKFWNNSLRNCLINALEHTHPDYRVVVEKRYATGTKTPKTAWAKPLAADPDKFFELNVSVSFVKKERTVVDALDDTRKDLDDTSAAAVPEVPEVPVFRLEAERLGKWDSPSTIALLLELAERQPQAWAAAVEKNAERLSFIAVERRRALTARQLERQAAEKAAIPPDVAKKLHDAVKPAQKNPRRRKTAA